MKTRTLLLTFSVCLFVLINLFVPVCRAADAGDHVTLFRRAIAQSMKQLAVSKDDKGVLLLTNAYYGQIDGTAADQYRDILSELSGCTTGKRSLLDVHTSAQEALWFALCQKSTNKIVFSRWNDGSFQSQTIDAAPEKILEVNAWKSASHSPIGPETLFQVVSIGLGWSAGTDWANLKAAGFHGELPPGVNIGYLFHRYLEKHMPLERGDQWVFFGALPKCYMDTLQVVYNTTLGKMQAYGLCMNKKQLSTYKTKGAMPCIVALKVNRSKDTCQGTVLGFSRKQVMDDLGVREADLNSKAGANDPVFCIARIKGSMQMAKMKPEQQLKWIVPMRKFTGKANLANRICNAGGDPYAIVWSK